MGHVLVRAVSFSSRNNRRTCRRLTRKRRLSPGFGVFWASSFRERRAKITLRIRKRRAGPYGLPPESKSSGTMMIGMLEVEMPGRRMRATLGDDLSWMADDHELRELLETISPSPVSSEEDHPHTAVGRYMLYRAGARLGAKVDVVPADA